MGFKMLDQEYCDNCNTEETHLNDMDCLAYENEQKRMHTQKVRIAKIIEDNKRIYAENGIKNLDDLNAYTLKVRKAGA
jgi:hypothetical protein